jgi:glutaredoxin 2
MAQTKQSKSLSKRTEVKKMSTHGRPKPLINTLLQTQVTRASALRNPQTLTSSIDVEKENQNIQNYSNEKKNLSISSFSSRSNKGRQKKDEIADQLSKNYFLNSK